MPVLPDSYTDLLPASVAADVVNGVADRDSALMGLCRQVRMPTRSEVVPVVSSAPLAGFVDAATGLKPEGEIDWTPLTLTAGEIGVIVGLPDAFVSDAQFPVWDSVRDEIVGAFTKVFEAAALYGTAAPAAWPTGGITAAAYAEQVTGTDALDALDKAMTALEQDGITPTGILGGAALRAALRQQTVVIMAPFDQAPASIYGVPIAFSTNWDDSKGIALVGGFEAGVLLSRHSPGLRPLFTAAEARERLERLNPARWGPPPERVLVHDPERGPSLTGDDLLDRLLAEDYDLLERLRATT